MEFDRKRDRFVLKELAPDVTVDEIKAKTAAEFMIDAAPIAVLQ